MGKLIEDVSEGYHTPLSAHTIAKHKLRDTSKDHCNASKEVVVATQSNQTLRRYSTLESAKNENGRCVRNKETDQTEESRISLEVVSDGRSEYRDTIHTEPFCKVTTRSRGLEEQTLVLLWAQRNSDLATELRTVPYDVVTVVLTHLVVDLVNFRHICRC